MALIRERVLWIELLLLLCVFLFFVFIACTSCTVNYGVEQGSICVRNDSENKGLVVREVYIKDKESEGYERIWKGNLSTGSCEFISVDDGNYSVKVLVSDDSAFGLYYELTTGYNIYKKVQGENCVYVIFDGSGVFFED